MNTTIAKIVKNTRQNSVVASARMYMHSRILCYANDLEQLVKGGGFEKDVRVIVVYRLNMRHSCCEKQNRHTRIQKQKYNQQ